MLARVGFLCFTLWLVGCRGPRIPHEGEFKLVDAAATPETLRLYGHLLDLMGKRVLFGHQDTLRYGHDWYGDTNRSDIHDVVGEHPALMGDDLSRLFDVHETPEVSFRTFVRYGQEATQLGMVRTFSWHMRNPVTNGESSDLTGGIASILPGGPHHAEYLGRLDRIAELFRALGPEPILFRPFHEHTGDWFWWMVS